jgi:hypothetical protein
VILLTFEIPEMGAVFLSKHTPFSQGKPVLGPPASDIDNFLPSDTVFLPFTCKGVFCP